MTLDYSEFAIEASRNGLVAYCKFITANDVGITGSHQVGYHIHKRAWPLFFDTPGDRGLNREKFVTIKWQNDFETNSRFIYYGTGTRNEYRLTRFGRGFPFLRDSDIGSLLVLCKITDTYYQAYVLETEQEIESYLNFFGVSPDRANGIISELTTAPDSLQRLIDMYLQTLSDEFPATEVLSAKAREIFATISQQTGQSITQDPDSLITHWVDTEYTLFKALEEYFYSSEMRNPFSSVESLVSFANTILNRRKSRAGKSLEHHLKKIFDINCLPYTSQGITEGKKRPDFIIPSIGLYHDSSYNENRLIFLGAKTTCKDRWRQVLNEADRIPHKHLFTLQQGISSNQLREMRSENLTLVVPEKHLGTFPAEYRSGIMTLKNFISYAKTTIQ